MVFVKEVHLPLLGVVLLSLDQDGDDPQAVQSRARCQLQ